MQATGETQARPGKENNPGVNFNPDFSNSKIPVPRKSRPVPDFKKLHESWQTQFHQGKAQSKKACTRPCPFSLTQKGERFEVLPATELGTNHPWQGYSESVEIEPPLPTGPQTLHGGGLSRGPLKEISLGPSNAKNMTALRDCAPGNSSAGPEFRQDPSALASILANVGLSRAPVPSGKQSLPLRVGMHRGPSAPHVGVLIGRMSAYAAPKQHHHHWTTGAMPRPSVLAEKGAAQRGPLQELHAHPRPPSLQQDLEVSEKPRFLPPAVKTDLSQTDASLKAVAGCMIGVVHPAVAGADPAKPGALGAQSGPQSSAEGAPLEEPGDAPRCSAPTVGYKTLKGPASRADVGHSLEFVTDPSALASILSNTGLSSTAVGNGKKLSMAQRVPVRGKGVTSLYAAGTSRDSAACAPRGSIAQRVIVGRMSCMPNLELPGTGTPHQAPRPGAGLHTEGVEPSPMGSARRVLDTNPARSKFRSLPKRRCPIFPKTPQARAVEAANRRLNAEAALPATPDAASQSVSRVTPQSSRPTRLKWSDDAPGTPDDDPAIPLEKVAVRLFLEPDNCQDGEGHSGKKTDQARRRRIEYLKKQLEEEMAALESQGSAEVAAAEDPRQFPNSTERLTLSQILSHWNAANISTGVPQLPQLPAATAHWHDLQAGAYYAPKPCATGTEMPFPHPLASSGPLMPGLSRLQLGGIEHRLPLAGALGVPLSKPPCPPTGLSFVHKSMTGISTLEHPYSDPYKAGSERLPFGGVGPSSAEHRPFSGTVGASSAENRPFSGTVGASSAEHRPFSGIVDASSTEHRPFSGVVGASSAEHRPFSGVVGASSAEHRPFSGVVGASSAEHRPFSGVVGASSVEHRPFSGVVGASSVEHRPFSGVVGVSSVEHRPFSGVDTSSAEHRPFSGLLGPTIAEHLPCTAVLPMPGIAATSTVLNWGTSTTFSSQAPVCSNLQIQPSMGPAGRSRSLYPSAVRPPGPRLLLTQMLKSFQEACLDDECHFYTSRPPAPCADDTLRCDTRNPLATMLEQEEATHFNPIKSPKT